MLDRTVEIRVNFPDHSTQDEDFWCVALKDRSGAQPATVAFQVAIFSVRANFFEICAVRVTSKIREPVLKLLSIFFARKPVEISTEDTHPKAGSRRPFALPFLSIMICPDCQISRCSQRIQCLVSV